LVRGLDDSPKDCFWPVGKGKKGYLNSLAVRLARSKNAAVGASKTQAEKGKESLGSIPTGEDGVRDRNGWQ